MTRSPVGLLMEELGRKALPSQVVLNLDLTIVHHGMERGSISGHSRCMISTIVIFQLVHLYELPNGRIMGSLTPIW